MPGAPREADSTRSCRAPSSKAGCNSCKDFLRHKSVHTPHHLFTPTANKDGLIGLPGEWMLEGNSHGYYPRAQQALKCLHLCTPHCRNSKCLPAGLGWVAEARQSGLLAEDGLAGQGLEGLPIVQALLLTRRYSCWANLQHRAKISSRNGKTQDWRRLQLGDTVCLRGSCSPGQIKATLPYPNLGRSEGGSPHRMDANGRSEFLSFLICV